MYYAKLNNGELEYATPNYKLPNGSIIINFNQNIELMKHFGFKLLIDEKPEFDPLTQTITITGYTETDESISIQYEVINQPSTEPTFEDRLSVLEEMDVNIVATNWDMDFRICELEWFLETTVSETENIKLKLLGGNNIMALSRFEQAKIMILGGAYNRETLTRQLDTYLKRSYLTQEEHDELISLMNAEEIVKVSK